MDERIKVYVTGGDFDMRTRIYIVMDCGEKRRVLRMHEGRPIWDEENLESNEVVPTLIFPHYVAPMLLQALSDELARKGIKPPDGHKTEGLLEAQTKHLNDLRTLLELK